MTVILSRGLNSNIFMFLQRFPIPDKGRLQKWVDNIQREEWTPSRHQCVCSEHFTDDCFDIRWGIRYLKNTAIPTIFPAPDDDGEKKMTISRAPRSPKSQTSTTETNAEPEGFGSHPSERPLILRKACKATQKAAENNVVAEKSVLEIEIPLVPETCITRQTSPPEIQNTEVTGDSGITRTSSPVYNKLHAEEKAEPAVATLCFGTQGVFTDGEANVDAAALHATGDQTFHFLPVELVKEKPTGCFLEVREPTYAEHISVYEHSYCRPDTDRDQLWNRILGLHGKILELDRREEKTVTKIHALENEIALLKRDSAIFKEKQKALEDHISSIML
ncbi:THAP domain-containing protein 5-like isoform X2 [Cololabis saira]|uniref:THAP domain-containing protein 5-like isoform X2 n=1 Tax=Cololabis saira TaxID=129043 RepID=UPI002AD1F5C0|nr:THAP domain-containing protein 5-like isoform X2 [Cololabis saira]